MDVKTNLIVLHNKAIGKLEIKTGVPSGAGAKQDFEILSQSGQSLIDAWSAPKIGNK